MGLGARLARGRARGPAESGPSPRCGVDVHGTNAERSSPLEREALADAPAPSWARQQRRVYLAFVLPALLVLFVVTIVPTVFVLGISLTNLNPSRPNTLQFVGLANYAVLLHDGRFWNSLWVQLRLSFWTVSLQLLIGLGMAVLLNSRLRFLELVRSVFIIPMVLPPIIVAIIWKILFTP